MKTRGCGIRLFGKIRCSDWRPVRPIGDEYLDQNFRSELSDEESSGSEDEYYTERVRTMQLLELADMGEYGYGVESDSETEYEPDYNSHRSPM